MAQIDDIPAGLSSRAKAALARLIPGVQNGTITLAQAAEELAAVGLGSVGGPGNNAFLFWLKTGEAPTFRSGASGTDVMDPVPGAGGVGGGGVSKSSPAQPGATGGRAARTPKQIITDLQAGTIDRVGAVGQLATWYMSQGLLPQQAQTAANEHLNKAGFPVSPASATSPPDTPTTGTPTPSKGGKPVTTSKAGVPKPTLEDILGSALARDVGFRQFMGRTAPGGLGGGFQRFFEEQQPRFENRFLLERALNPQAPSSFESFLSGAAGGDPLLTTGGIIQPQIEQLARLLSPGTNTQGLGTQQQAALSALGGKPQAQFSLFLQPQLRGLAGDIRGAFANLMQRRFEEFLASRSQEPGFEFLPELAKQGFRF